MRYDGPDLADVAAATDLSATEVIAAHTGTRWGEAFVGFAPGFALPDRRRNPPHRAEPGNG